MRGCVNATCKTGGDDIALLGEFASQFFRMSQRIERGVSRTNQGNIWTGQQMLIAFDRENRGRIIKLVKAFRIAIAATEQQGGARCLICCYFSLGHAEANWFKSAAAATRQLRKRP